MSSRKTKTNFHILIAISVLGLFCFQPQVKGQCSLTSATITTPITCLGGTATVTFIASGGTEPYNYTFNGVNNTSGIFSDVPAGTGLTYSITDASLCGPLTGTLDITAIADTVPPVITDCPANITLYTGAGNITCFQAATWTEPTAADNCAGVVSYTLRSHVPGSLFPVGTSTVTYTFKDPENNTSQCSFTITVIDNTPPSISCNSYSVNIPDDLPASNEFTEISAIDNCAGPVEIRIIGEEYQWAEGSPGFCPKSLTRRFIAIDQYGNTSSECTQVITVLDNSNCKPCQDNVPYFMVNFADNPGGIWTSPPVVRQGLCCQSIGPPPPRCVSFDVYLDEDAVGIVFKIITGAVPGGALYYHIDCGPPTQVNEAICLAGGRSYNITFCEPGNNSNVYQIESISGATIAEGITTRQDANCLDTLSVTGLDPNNITWIVKSPDDQSLLRYLSCTDCLNPVFTPDENTPPSIIYEVCGTIIAPYMCNDLIITDCKEVEVITLPAIKIHFDVDPGNICANNIPTISALIDPIDLSYNYQWFNGPDGTGTLLSTNPNWKPSAEGSYSLVVTETVTGLKCNSATYNFDVVFDVLGPSVVAPPVPLIIECNDPDASPQINDWLALATGSYTEPDGTIINIVPSNDYSGIEMSCNQTLTVTFSAADICGNVSSVTSTISVTDTESPTWSSLPGSLDVSVECIDYDALALANTYTPVAADNCDLVLIPVKTPGTFTSGTCPEAGSYTNTWIVTDACGNTSSVFTQLITVLDQTGPTIGGAIPTVTVEGCSLSALPDPATSVAELETLGLTINDPCAPDPSLTITSIDTFSGNCPITAIRTYTITDICGNQSTYQQTFNIADIQPAIITGTLIPLHVTGCDTSAAPDAAKTIPELESLGITISDLCSPDERLLVSHTGIISGVCPLTITRTYQITDECGNTATAVQLITINTPALILPANDFVVVNCVDEAVDPDAPPAITDPCGVLINPVLISKVSYPEVITCSGTIIWVYRYTACDGTYADWTYTSIIEDTTPPVISTSASGSSECQGADPNLNTDYLNWLANFGGAVATDQCNNGLSWVITPGTWSGGCNNTITVTITATDSCNNPSSKSETFTISDNTPPVLTCNQTSDLTIDANADSTYIHTGSSWDATATDICSGIVLSADLTGATNATGLTTLDHIVFKEGATTVTWTAVDNCGNISTCTFTITVYVPADLAVIKSASPSPANAGEEVIYTITVTNHGPGTGRNVVVTDIITAFPDALYTTNLAAGPWAAWPGNFLIGTLYNGGSFTFFIKGVLAIDQCSPISNTVSVANDTRDDFLGNNTFTLTTEVIDQEDPTISQCPVNRVLDGCSTDVITAPPFSDTETNSTFLEFQDGTNQGGAIDNCGISEVKYIDVVSGTCPNIVTRTWIISDAAGNETICTQLITINAPTVSTTAPTSLALSTCDFTNATSDPVQAQADLDARLAQWISEGNAALTATGGCDPVVTNDYDNSSLDLCSGGSITITWTLVDLCQTQTATATFTLTPPTSISVSAPASITLSTCDFTNAASDAAQAQTDLDARLAQWVSEGNSALTATGGCDPVVTNDYDNSSLDLCSGGSITITWTLVDLCQTQTATATFTLAPPTSITVAAPASITLSTCDLNNAASDPAQAQADLDARLAQWISEGNTALTATGGCDPVVTNDYDNSSLDLCTGGSITITWTLVDLCQTQTATATFTLTPPPAISVAAPASITRSTCDFTNAATDPAQAQADLDARLAQWVSEGNAALTASGGCDPVVTNDYTNGQIDLCTGGSITITWTLVDLCQTQTATATFTLTPPPSINVAAPASINLSTCDFTNAASDPAQAQADLDARLAQWISEGNAALAASGGCDPVVTNDYNNGQLDLCSGGSITITWTMVDLCQTQTTSATFTLTPPPAISVAAPASITLSACDFTNATSDTAQAQADLDASLAQWITEGNAALAATGGCDPVVTNDYANGQLDLCTGGSITITWTMVDLCQTQTTSATFTLTPPPAISVAAPASITLSTCDLNNVASDPAQAQADLDARLAQWISEGNTALAATGGCDPVVTNDYNNGQLDLCTGGSITITWTLVDLCQTQTATATFTLTPPPAISVAAPISITLSTCDFTNAASDAAQAQADLDARLAQWISEGNAALTATGGCDPVVTNDYDDSSLDLCTGGAITINWTLVDLCQTQTATATFTLTPPTSISVTAPASITLSTCDLNNATSDPVKAQADLDALLAQWISDGNAALAASGGCDPVVTNDYDNSSMDLCTGGSITITWTLVDLCQTQTATATFTLTPPTSISVAAPASITLSTCDFTNAASDASQAQVDLDARLAQWVSEGNTALSATGGCDPVVTNDYDNSRLDLCTGGSITITWTLVDLCQTQTATATFTLTPPPAISVATPASITLSACDFTNATADPVQAQADLDARLAQWVSEGNAALTATGGCDPVVTNDYDNSSLDLCTGGSITITWTLVDLCQTQTATATFTLTPPPAINVATPSSITLSACDFTNTASDPAQAQADLDARLAQWVSEGNVALTATGGCDPVVTNDYDNSSLDLCTGGTITISWTLVDLCQTQTATATFTLTPPPSISVAAPANLTISACDLNNATSDPVKAQADLDALLAQWISEGNAALAASGGCDPVVTNDYDNSSIDLCTGGSITITWTLVDLCQTQTATATFTLTPPPAISIAAPASITLSTCDFINATSDPAQAQADLDARLAQWVSEGNAAFTATGGCDPVVTNDYDNSSLDLCTGGSITITWTLVDLCQTQTATATFTLTPPPAISIAAPASITLSTCDFTNATSDPAQAQADLDARLAQWISDGNADFSATGGCDPVVTNDYDNSSLDLCTGGSITITWTLVDLCQTQTATATFTLTPPPAISVAAPASLTISACDLNNATSDPVLAQTDLDVQLAQWVSEGNAALTATGGCDPVVTNDYDNSRLDLCTGGSITITWTLVDLCQTQTATATFTLTPPPAISVATPANLTISTCDLNNATSDPVQAQADLDARLAQWVSDGNAAFSATGGCDPVVTNDYDNDRLDLCTGGSITITWTLVDLCQTQTSTATFTLTPPPAISVATPANLTISTCDLNNATSDPVQAQADLDARLAQWVSDGNAAFTATGGCDPVVTNDYDNGNLDLCTGGSITITWTLVDLCQTQTAMATFTLTPPPAISVATPASLTVSACDFNNQSEVDIAFNKWLDDNIALLILSGGCDPKVESNITLITPPDLCTGGSSTLNWTFKDICQTQTLTASFNLLAPTQPEMTGGENGEAECTGINPGDNPAYQAWLANNGGIEVIDICYSPTISNNSGSQTWTSIDCNYEIEITFTAVGKCGIVNSKALKFTITDTEPPVADTPEPITVECISEVPAPDISTITGVYDLCSNPIVRFSGDVSTGNCPLLITRTYSVEDACGNKTLIIQEITVEDTTPPTLTLAISGVLDCNPDADAINSAFGTPAATDNCSGLLIPTYTDIETQIGCTVTITRTWTVSDDCGNSTTDEQMVTFTRDLEPPVLNAGNPTMRLCNPTTEEINTAFGNPIVTDNCDSGITVTFSDRSPESDGCSSSITRTWTATDHCGNTASIDQIITFTTDIEPPVISITAPSALQCNPSATEVDAAFGKVSVSDNCTVDLSVTYTIGDEVHDACKVSITRIWTVIDDCNNAASIDQTITFSRDNTPPVITLTDPALLVCNPTPDQVNTAYGTATITDDCPEELIIDITDSPETNSGCSITTTRTWTATDGCGNVTIAVQTLNFTRDYEAPVLTCPADQTFCELSDNNFTISSLIINDNCDSPLDINFEISGATERSGFGTDASGNFNIGTSIITWTVSDHCGNTAFCTTAITVNPQVTPEFDPIPSICQNTEAPLLTNISKNGINGTWDPPAINTAVSGSATYTFYPDAEECAKIFELSVMIDPEINPEFDPIPDLCLESVAPVLPLVSLNGITGTWSPATIDTGSAGTTTHTFTPDSGQCAIPRIISITVILPVVPTFDAIGPFWQFDPAPSLPDISTNNIKGTWKPSTISTDVIGVTTYVFTPDEGQCALGTTIDILVMPRIDPTFDPIGPLCQYSAAPPLPLVSLEGITGTWSPETIDTSVPGIFTFTFTPHPGQGANPATITVEILPQIHPAFEEIGMLCLNSAAPELPTISTNGIAGTWYPADISTATSGTFIYTFTPEPGVCASNTLMTITVTDLPVITIAPIAPLCEGAAAFELTATPEGGVFSGPGLSGATFDPASTGVGTFTITYSYLDSGGCSNSGSISIVVNENPELVVNDPDAACMPGTVNLTAASITEGSSPDLTFTYWVDAAATFALANPMFVGAGTYYIKATNSNGCIDIKPVNVVVIAAPIIVITDPEPICEPGTIDLTASAITEGSTPGLIYTYWTDEGATISYSNPAAAGNGTYYIKGTSLDGCSTIQPVQVVIIGSVETPIFDLGPSSVRCQGAGTVIYNATAVNSTSISYALDVMSIEAGNTINPANGEVTYTDAWSGTSYIYATAEGCNGPLTAIHAAKTVPAPAATIAYEGSPYCSTARIVSVIMTGTPGGTYSALPAGLAVDEFSGDINPGLSKTGTYTVIYKVYAEGGCGVAIATASVTIIKAPTAKISYVGSPFCTTTASADVILTGSTGGWFTARPAGLSINSDTGTIYPSASDAGNYTVTYKVITICGLVIAETEIIIEAAPEAHVSYPDAPFCKTDESGTVLLEGTPGGIFTATPAGLTIDAKTGEITPNTSEEGTYTITYTLPAVGNCGPVITTTIISVVSAPSANIAYLGTPFCITSNPVQVTLTGASGGTFTADPDGLTIDPITGTITPSESKIGLYKITYTVDGSGECGGTTATASIWILSAQTASISYIGSPFCIPSDPVEVIQSGPKGGTYTAIPNGLTIDRETGNIDPATSLPGTYQITYTVEGICGIVVATTEVTTTTGPTADISYPSPQYCSTSGPVDVFFEEGAPGGIFSSEPPGLVIDPATGTIDPSRSMEGTYTVIYTNLTTGACGEGQVMAKATVTISALLTAGFYYAGTPFCTTSPTGIPTFTGSTLGKFSSSTGLSVNPKTGAINPGASEPGDYLVTYNIPAIGDCGEYTTTAPVTILKAPAATILYGGPYCTTVTTGQAVTLFGDAGGTFTSSAGLSINSSTGTILPSSSIPGTYVITYLIPSAGICGGASAKTTITINAPPEVHISYEGSPYCQTNKTGQNVLLTGASGGYFNAEPGGLSIDPITGTIIPSISFSGKYMVTYTLPGSGGCDAVSSTTSVNITTPPYASFYYPGNPFCFSFTGSEAPILTGTPMGTYSSTPGLQINGMTGAITPSLSKIGTYVVTYTIKASGGCESVIATTTVTIRNGPTAEISYPDAGFCITSEPASANITGVQGGVFTVSPDGLSIDSATGSITPGNSIPGIYTVTYTISATDDCGSAIIHATATITIYSQPVATFEYLGSPFCNNESNPMPVFIGEGVAGTFTSSEGLVFVDVHTGEINLSASTPGTYLITNTIPASGGCDEAIGTSTITISSLPVADFLYLSPFCSTDADPDPIFINGGIAGTFSSTEGLVFNDVHTGRIDLSASIPGTYTVTNTIYSEGGCGTVTASTDITITKLPVATFFYENSPYCNNETNPYPTFIGEGIAGTFSSTEGLVFINIHTGQIDLSASIPGDYTVTNTIDSIGGCGPVTASASIAIEKAPGATIHYDGSPFCENISDDQPVSLTGTLGGVFSSLPAGLSLNPDTGSINPEKSIPGDYVVIYTIEAGGACGPYSTTTMVSITAFDASIMYSGSEFCTTTEPVLVILTGSPGGVFSSLPDGLSLDTVTGQITPATSLPGNYVITYTNSKGGCGLIVATTLIRINEAPNAEISYGGPFCQTDPGKVTPNLTGTTGGVFSAVPSGLWIDPISGEIMPSESKSGTYEVTYTIKASGGCAEFNAIATLTIGSATIVTTSPKDQFIVLSYDAGFGVTAMGDGLSYQWQVNDGSGFKNISDNGIYSGALTDSLHLTAPPMSMNGYKYQVVVNGVCAPSAVSKDAVLNIRLKEFVLVVTAIGIDKMYDGNTSDRVTLYDNRQAGDSLVITYSTANFYTKDVGTDKPVFVTGIVVTGPDAGKYGYNTTTITSADIVPKPITATAIAGLIKTYGAADPAFTYTYTPELIPGDHFTGNLQRVPGENPGFYPILQGSLSLSFNYILTYIPNDFEITYKTAINVVVSAGQKKVYGDNDPVLTFTYYPELESGDEFEGQLSREMGENIGEYLINRGTLRTSPKYAIFIVPSYFLITPKPITVTAVEDIKVYDGNIYSDETPAISPNLAFDDTGEFAQVYDTKNVGINKTMSPAGHVNDGNDGKNYQITLVKADVGIITPKPIIGSFTSPDKVYDGTVSATIQSRGLTGVIKGDDVSFIGGSATFDTPNVGHDKTVTGIGFSITGNDAYNYTANETAIALADILILEIPTTLTVNSSTFSHYSDLVTLTATAHGGAPLAGGPQAALSTTFSIGGRNLRDQSNNTDIPLKISGSDLIATITLSIMETTFTGSLVPGVKLAEAFFNDENENYRLVPNPAKASFEFTAGFSVQVYPNPSPGPVTFKISVDIGAQTTLDLYTDSGQLVARLFDGFIPTSESRTIPVSLHLAQGIYRYYARVGNQVRSGNVIIVWVY